MADFLNAALNCERFPRQYYRRFRIEPWVGKSPFPRRLIPWTEGGSEIDVQISWENPPTTVFVECKYGSALSGRTNQNDGSHGFPSDQLVRNIRVNDPRSQVRSVPIPPEACLRAGSQSWPTRLRSAF